MESETLNIKKCSIHQDITSSSNCKRCNIEICDLCNFKIFENIFCPTCVSEVQNTHGEEKGGVKNGFISFGLFGVSSFVILLMMFGGLDDPSLNVNEFALEIFFSIFGLGPSVWGIGLASTGYDRTVGRPMILKIALTLHILIVVLIVIFAIIGMFLV
jgi:hypothetical protein